MQDNNLSLFKSFYATIADLSDGEIAQYPTFTSSLQAELESLDPIAANELVQSKLIKIEPDEELLNLYNELREFQDSAMGEPYEFEPNHPFVLAIAAIAETLNEKSNHGADVLPKLQAKFQEALLARVKVNVLTSHIKSNASALNEYRFRLLENGVTNSSQLLSVEDPKSFGEFTHTQQAIAIHYLFQEALGITGVDTTRLMEFAHLLSAKKIPLSKDTGKENIRNSGIKSAFNKAWKKEDANHLNDLRFVLRFFKPLNSSGAAGIQNAVAALEKRIAKLSEKLNKEKD